jgi:hypothetical protein
LIPKDATARGWNIDYGLPDVFDDWCCAVSPRELDFTKFPIVGNGGLFRPSTIAPTPFSALRRRYLADIATQADAFQYFPRMLRTLLARIHGPIQEENVEALVGSVCRMNI